MKKIFISYRRSDTSHATARVYDRLVAAFGKRSVFKDVDSLQPGESFPTAITEVITACDVVLVIMGDHWLANESGKTRLAEPNDFVRKEIETAMALGRPVVPLLIGNACMPDVNQLPASIYNLAYCHAVSVRDDPHFQKDMDQLIASLKSFQSRSDIATHERIANRKVEVRWKGVHLCVYGIASAGIGWLLSAASHLLSWLLGSNTYTVVYGAIAFGIAFFAAGVFNIVTGWDSTGGKDLD